MFFLTHLIQMEFPTVILWNSPFLFYGILGGIFHFYSNFNRTFCKQTVETLIRRRVLRRPIFVCTVCICPTKRMLGLYGLNIAQSKAMAMKGLVTLSHRTKS